MVGDHFYPAGRQDTDNPCNISGNVFEDRTMIQMLQWSIMIDTILAALMSLL